MYNYADGIEYSRKAVEYGNPASKVWLARDLDFFPVKIEQYRKGELHLSMILDRFNIK